MGFEYLVNQKFKKMPLNFFSSGIFFTGPQLIESHQVEIYPS